MSRHRFAALPAALSATLLLGGCQAQGPAADSGITTVPHRVLHASATCGTEEASVRRIADSLRLKEVMQSGGMLGVEPAVPAADFSRQLVLRLSMGQQPTAGSQFAVTGVRADSRTQRLLVDMAWSPPAPGSMNAQVITRPCVLLGVPAGAWRSVQVLDAQGREKASATLPG